MRTPRGQPLRYGVRVSFQDHGEVRAVSFGIEMPQEGRVDTVEPLHDKAGRDIPIADDGLSAFRMRVDFRLHMVVAVGCIQAGKGVAGNRFSQLPAQHADRPV